MKYLVTGANRGLGLEFTRRFAARGDTVLATSRDPSSSPDLEALASANPDRVRPLQLDVTSAESVAGLTAALGDESIDVLLNNAGHMGPYTGIENLDWENMDRCFRINVMGPLRVIQAVLGNLRRSRVRHIVNMSSKMGSITDNTSGGAYAYRMSKAALNMANKSLSNDLADEGFVCIVMHPGWVRTRMGGPSGVIDVETSVSNMIERIDELGPEHNGSFVEWSGGTVPW